MKELDRTFLENVKRFFEPVFCEKKISIKASIPPMLFSIVGIITVYLLKEITNKLSGGWSETVSVLFIIFIFFILFYNLTNVFLRNWTHATIYPMFRKVLFKKYIKKCIYLDNNEYEKIGTGKLIAMLGEGMSSWVELLVVFITNVLPNIVFIILSFIFIGLINIYYFFFVFFAFIFILIITYFSQKKAKKYRDLRRDSNIGVTKRFVKILMSKYEILQNNKLDSEGIFIFKSLDNHFYLNTRVMNFHIIVDLLSKIFIDGSKILIILMFGIGLLGGSINFGEFVSLLSVVYILDQIFIKFISLYVSFTKEFTNVEKLWDLFDTTPEIKGYETGNEFKYKAGDIEIKDLSYYYTKGQLVFKNFNLKIDGEKVLALVGNSGSGKSTLAKLISGYIHPIKGNVIVDGQKLNKTSLKSYYREIGYLTQEPSVFDGTIIDNLTYAIDRDLIEGELDNIIKLSKCEFIYDLPKGLDTEIGERGVRLSGGQKQRLAIAKIFLKNPKIIILDEPTSALDSFSEEQITKAMHNLFKNRTVIVIAHRLQTVKYADKIIVLEDGKVVETGNHKELVKQKGIYKKMLDLQSGF